MRTCPYLPPHVVVALAWCAHLLSERRAGRLTPDQSAQLDRELLRAAYVVLLDQRQKIRA